MKLTKVLIAAAALGFAGVAGAQCSSAVTITSNETVPTVNTCSFGPISIGGTVYSNVAIFKFVAQGATGTVNISDPNYGILVSQQCQNDPSLDSFGATSANANVISDGNTGYVFIFRNNTADSNKCSTLTGGLVVNGTLPVALKSFSVK
jgi:hypothetical protein